MLKDTPFPERKFTVNGEPCDIEDFISIIATDFKDAAQLRDEIAEMAEGFHMYLGHGDKEQDLFRMS